MKNGNILIITVLVAYCKRASARCAGFLRVSAAACAAPEPSAGQRRGGGDQQHGGEEHPVPPYTGAARRFHRAVQQIQADRVDEKLGVEMWQRQAMEGGSICGWDVPGADPAKYLEDYDPKGWMKLE